MKTDKPIECVGCNTFDVGSILDNSELSVDYENVFSRQAEAENVLKTLTEKARETESDPCQISSEITAVEEGFRLQAKFTFSCQAEVVIFQLATRKY